MSSPIREVPENEPLLTSDGTPNDNETGSGQGPWVRQPLTRINKVIRVASVAVIATASANFALSVAVVVMLYYGISNFDRGDWEIEWAGPSFLWAALFSFILAIINVSFLRRKGKPANILLNIFVLLVTTYVTLPWSVLIMTRRTFRYGLTCDGDDYGQPHRGTDAECEEWLSEYMILTWFYLAVTLALGLEYAVLLVTFFVKLYKEHTRSSSSGSQFSLPAGYLSFEVSLKWGAPKPSEARETNTEGRRED